MGGLVFVSFLLSLTYTATTRFEALDSLYNLTLRTRIRYGFLTILTQSDDFFFFTSLQYNINGQSRLYAKPYQLDMIHCAAYCNQVDYHSCLSIERHPCYRQKSRYRLVDDR